MYTYILIIGTRNVARCNAFVAFRLHVPVEIWPEGRCIITCNAFVLGHVRNMMYMDTFSYRFLTHSFLYMY